MCGTDHRKILENWVLLLFMVVGQATSSGWSLGYYFNVIQLVVLYITHLCGFTVHTFGLL